MNTQLADIDARLDALEIGVVELCEDARQFVRRAAETERRMLQCARHCDALTQRMFLESMGIAA